MTETPPESLFTEAENAVIAEAHKLITEFHAFIDRIGTSSELALAKKDAEAALAWIKKHIFRNSAA